jgi:hypothetical protein
VADPGDVIFQMAQDNKTDSGPGGVIRDRAIDLARGGLSVDQAIAQATAETHTGHNPRDPSGGAADKPGGSPDNTAAATKPAATAVGSSWSVWARQQTIIPGVPNWAVAAGAGVLARAFLMGR